MPESESFQDVRMRPYQRAINEVLGYVYDMKRGRMRPEQHQFAEEAVSRDSMVREWLEQSIRELDDMPDRDALDRLQQQWRVELCGAAHIDLDSGAWPDPEDMLSFDGFIDFGETYQEIVQRYRTLLQNYGLTPDDFSRCLDLLIQPMNFAWLNYFGPSDNTYFDKEPMVRMNGVDVYPWQLGSAGVQCCPFGDGYFGTTWEAQIRYKNTRSSVAQLLPHLIRDHQFPESDRCPAGSMFNLEGLCAVFTELRMQEWEKKEVRSESLTIARKVPCYPACKVSGLEFYSWEGKVQGIEAYERLREGFRTWERDDGLYYSMHDSDPTIVLVSETPCTPDISAFRGSFGEVVQVRRMSVGGKRVCHGNFRELFVGKPTEQIVPLPGLLQVQERTFAYPAHIDIADPETYVVQDLPTKPCAW